MLPLLPIPIVPEHVWKNVIEKEMKSYAAEPKDGKPVVGSGPFRLVEGTAGGSTFRFEKNPDYWNGTPHVDEVVYRVYKSNDPAVQALIKGEVDFVDDITPLQVRALQGQRGHHRPRRQSHRCFEEIGFNTGAVDTETGKPIGDGNPALKDPKFRHALGYAVDTARLVKSAFQGAATPGSTVVPDAYTNYHWKPAGLRGLHASTWPRPASCWTRRGTRRAPTGSARCPTAARWARCGCSAAPSRSPRSTPWTSSRSGWPTSASTPRSPRWTAASWET